MSLFLYMPLGTARLPTPKCIRNERLLWSFLFLSHERLFCYQNKTTTTTNKQTNNNWCVANCRARNLKPSFDVGCGKIHTTRARAGTLLLWKPSDIPEDKRKDFFYKSEFKGWRKGDSVLSHNQRRIQKKQTWKIRCGYMHAAGQVFNRLNARQSKNFTEFPLKVFFQKHTLVINVCLEL